MNRGQIALILLIALTMCLVFATAVADDAVSFDTPLTDLWKKSASSWYSTVEDRANLTIFLLLDLQNHDDSVMAAENVTSNSTYVGIDEDDQLLVVSFQSDHNTVIVLYAPSHGGLGAQYLVLDQHADIFTELTLSRVCREYKKNQPTDLGAAAKRILELVGN